MFKQKILLWLMKKIKKELRDIYMKENGSSLKCTNCNRWSCDLYWEGKSIKYFETDFGYSTRCGNCDSVSYWNLDAAPVPLLCDAMGNPYG